MPNPSTVLIVDDKPSARELLRAILLEQGYTLAFATSGQEALTSAAELSPDVILLDVMMPGLDGFEVCRQLRADPVLAQVPVILITALDDEDSVLQGLEAGADDFISKPFNQAELRARVRTITRLNRYRRLLIEQTKFEWVVNQANDGYLLTDDDDHIRYANPHARLYLGLPADKPITATFLEVACGPYRCEPAEAWQTWPEPSPSPRYLVQSESPTARSSWLQVNVLDLPGRVDGDRVVQLRNVTFEMALWNDMWEFETLISHKLRTPLGGVVTGLELLKEDYNITDLLDKDGARVFELIYISAQRLKRDILGILEYISLPTLAQPGQRFDVSALTSLITQLSAELGLTEVSVTDRRSALTGQILLSAQSMELILREILGNSKKFHPHHTPKIEVVVSDLTGKQVGLQIKDDGLTLAPEQLARVWLPYYQADKYFTGEVAGMGLGLSRVAFLVWSVGGSCRLNNRSEGPGVTVELALPLEPPPVS